MSPPTASRLGERAVVLAWEQRIDPDLNAQIVAFSESLAGSPLPGYVESLPAYASLTVFFDFCAPPNVEGELLERWARRTPVLGSAPRRTIRIPVQYDGPDLAPLSAATGLSVEEIVKIHTGRTYHVYLVGFLPGFAYMGEVDERIAAARHATPRVRVPAGSVGIAGKQTGIYPLESPGGWQIIGRTPLAMFDPTSPDLALLRAGDQVIFEAIR